MKQVMGSLLFSFVFLVASPIVQAEEESPQQLIDNTAENETLKLEGKTCDFLSRLVRGK
ncbi:hypothetical protein [Oceanobacillus halotolerans]|uniref:hypothetical protein n=1 Tax=Oceanobacillus halotolerans TaxID=2663380 RepID=UPI0013D95033|nr:hypothetical protein [Oceanobacillus halotolerans]